MNDRVLEGGAINRPSTYLCGVGTNHRWKEKVAIVRGM